MQTVKDLVNWCEWGQQWIIYLRQKPEMASILQGQSLRKFETAFEQIGQKATYALGRPPGNEELARLIARATSVHEQFQQLLDRVQQKKTESLIEPASIIIRKQPAQAPLQPVPIGGHKLPPLPYAYDALEPYIDEETMRLHHNKHHQSYVDGLNKAETMLQKARANNDFALVKHWERELAFHGAGHYLHTIFWNVMTPNGSKLPEGDLKQQIERDFGSVDAFKKHFSQAAEKVEGGGWAILVWAPRAQRLEILTAEKHQNLSQWDVIPLLVLDVWEHAYYLTYRNERGKYIDAWWNVVNWDHVAERFAEARQLRWRPY